MKLALTLIGSGLLGLSLLAAGQGHGKMNNGSYGTAQQQMVHSPDVVLSQYPVSVLTEGQKQDLEFMYQEEKLARDVYLEMFDRYEARIFQNIANSEQQHMNAIQALLDRYGLPTPTADDRGVFADAEINHLYVTLLEQGRLSLNDALSAGKTIEEKDIADLESKMKDAPEDVAAIYERLLQGSENHLRAFTRQLQLNNTQISGSMRWGFGR